MKNDDWATKESKAPYGWEGNETADWNEKETGDVGSKGALNDIGSKATKAVFDALGYKIVKTEYSDIGSKVTKVVLGDVGNKLTDHADNFDEYTASSDLF